MAVNRTVVIAVDGPAASGKGTLARRLAAHFGYAHLDSGLLYRATALRLLRRREYPRKEQRQFERFPETIARRASNR